MTRNLTKKRLFEFKNLLDDAVRSLAKKNIDLLKILISTNAKSIAKPDKKVSSLESKLIYMEMQDNSKARKR